MNLWKESEIMEIAGKRYLNSEATRRFLKAYGDRLKFSSDVDPDDILISYSYATRVVEKYPFMSVANNNYSLNDFLGANADLVSVIDPKKFATTSSDASAKQLPVLVTREHFLNTSDQEVLYTDDELKVIEYFKEKGKVNLYEIPKILKGQGLSMDMLVKYGYLLSKALPWYTFTSSDEQELREWLIKYRIQKFGLTTAINFAKDLDEIISILKAYKKYGDGTCSKTALTNAIMDFLSKNFITDDDTIRFLDALSSDEVFEGAYLKDYLTKMQTFRPTNYIDDADIIEPVTADNVITLEDLTNFDNTEIYEDVKEYIEKYFLVHGNSSVPSIDKIEWTKNFIENIYHECIIEDHQILLNTLYQHLADREPFNISRSDINDAFKQLKDELENRDDHDMKDMIYKCIHFGKPYHELFKIYKNSSVNKWDKYDRYVIEVIKDKIDYSLSISSKNAYQLYARSLGLIMSDIKRLSDTLKTDTFKKLSSSLNMTEAKLDDLLVNYNVGLGDPIKDFGLQKSEPTKDDNDESFSIKKRRKPKTKQEIKKYIFTALAGAGIISCLYLTFVLERNPINVIKNCVSTFQALFKGNSTLAALGASMGNLTAYFGSAVVAIGSGLKLSKIIGQEDDVQAIKQDDSQDSPSFEELEPSDSEGIDLEDLVDEPSNTMNLDDVVHENPVAAPDEPIDLTDMNFDEFTDTDSNSFDVKRR